MSRLALWHTVRGRLLLLAIGVELLMLSVLVANSARLLYSAMTRQAAWQAQQMAPVLNAALTAPLAQRDFATVQAVLDESRSIDGLLYLQVLDRQGTLVAASGTSDTQLQKLTSSNVFKLHLNQKFNRYDVTVPISQVGQPLGMLHFGLNLTQVFHARRALLAQGVGIAVVELILSSFVLLLLGFWLTRHLDALTKASLEVAAGNLTPSILAEGQDDIGQLGAAFNTMSRSIAERIHELDRQKALLGSTIDSTNDIMFFKDMQGVYLGCNPAFTEFIGKPREAIVGCTDYDLLPRESADFFREQDRQMLILGRSRSNEEWVDYPDGRRVLLETQKSPLRDQHGQIIGLIGISRDITERKQLEDMLHHQTVQLEQEVAERQKAQEALQARAGELETLNLTLESRVQEELLKNRQKDAIMLQQDKLASIGQLAAGVAHEINNPMGFIMSNLTTLQKYSTSLQKYFQLIHERANSTGHEFSGLSAIRKELDLDYILADLEPLLAESVEGAERVRRIVLDLKDFARTDEQEMHDADLNQLVQSTINIVRNELKYVARLDLQLGELPLLPCHPQQINQVISNLLVNAAHAIEQRGVITVRTWYEDGFVVMSVADTGKGIEPELVGRIFDPFFTTKEVGKGTGLGLSISYDIIKKHNGEILVESQLGTGTTFVIKLPVAARL